MLPADRQKFAGLPIGSQRRTIRAIFSPRLLFKALGIATSWLSLASLQALGVRNILDWQLFAFSRAARGVPAEYLCEMPRDMGGILLGRYLVNLESASYQERLQILYRTRLLDRLKQKLRPTIVEIGGGFGALAFCIKRIVPEARYVIVDLPGSLVHSACWLAQWCPASRIAVYQPESSVPTADFVLMPHTTFSGALELSIDLAINTLSFSEMSAETVADYASQIAKRLTLDGVLFEQNFDNSRYRDPRFCNPAIALQQHFSHRLIVPGKYWRGVPSVWSLQPLQ
jgi:hypothetical protein